MMYTGKTTQNLRNIVHKKVTIIYAVENYDTRASEQGIHNVFLARYQLRSGGEQHVPGQSAPQVRARGKGVSFEFWGSVHMSRSLWHLKDFRTSHLASDRLSRKARVCPRSCTSSDTDGYNLWYLETTEKSQAALKLLFRNRTDLQQSMSQTALILIRHSNQH